MNNPCLEDIAAEWAVKVEAGPLEPGEQAALEAWLEAVPRHAGAFARARAALEFAGPERLAPTLTGAKDRLARPDPTRRWMVGGAGLAAAAGLIIATGLGLWFFDQRRYATRIGETKVVPLADGSVVTLNTESEIAVDYTQDRRQVRLVQGEALFDVAKDKARPFFVLAGDTQVRAVGTSFTVKMLPGQPVQVLVREGVVEVRHPDQPAAPVRLAENSKGIAAAGAPIVVANISRAGVTRALAWRMGRISFEGESLKTAAAEFARYSNVRIEIAAADVENQTVAGLFTSNDPIGFAKAVSASFGLHITVTENTVRLSH